MCCVGFALVQYICVTWNTLIKIIKLKKYSLADQYQSPNDARNIEHQFEVYIIQLYGMIHRKFSLLWFLTPICHLLWEWVKRIS